MAKRRGRMKSIMDIRRQMMRISQLGEKLYGGQDYYGTDRATTATDAALWAVRNIAEREGLNPYDGDMEYMRAVYSGNSDFEKAITKSYNDWYGKPKLDWNKKYSRAARMGKAAGGAT